MPITITGEFVPGGAFGLVNENNLVGGYRSVANATALNSITALYRKEGMKVRALDTGQEYVLNASPWNFNIGDWTAVFAGAREFLLPFSTTVHNLVGSAAATATDIGTNVFDGPSQFPTGAVAYFRGFIDTSGAGVAGELKLLDLTNGSAVLATLTGSAQNPQLITSAAIAFPVGVVNLGATFRTTVATPESYDRVTARGVHLQIVW